MSFLSQCRSYEVSGVSGYAVRESSVGLYQFKIAFFEQSLDLGWMSHSQPFISFSSSADGNVQA